MTHNIMIAGVGGQGTVLASKLIAAAAMKKGFDVRTTETIGMAQRGGSVFGHIRIGENIFSPLIPLGKADAIIAFEPAEAVRQLPYLKKDGTVIVYASAINPTAGTYNAGAVIEYLKTNVTNLIIIDEKQLAGQNSKTLNVCLLGAAAQYAAKFPSRGVFPFDADVLKEVLAEILPERFLEMNIKAFELGRSII